VYPMDLRAQSHEIIRTWLFATVLRAHLADGRLPFEHVAVSGWIVDPDRKKMSKSKGNVTTPMEWIDRYGADAVRYWAAKARPGVDSAFTLTRRHDKRTGRLEDANEQMEQGRRVAIKLLNASKFILSAGAAATGPVTEPMDRAQLARLAATVRDATEAFEGYDYARALEVTESAFWDFTDNYLELTKARSYGDLGAAGQASAHATLRECLSIFQRLLAPFMPYCAEETWSWWRDGSIHRAGWPAPPTADGRVETLAAARDVIGAARKAKSDAHAKMRHPIARMTVTDTPERLELIGAVAADLQAAGVIAELSLRAGEAFGASVELAA
jgi:valyl-tRNA synthetase